MRIHCFEEMEEVAVRHGAADWRVNTWMSKLIVELIRQSTH